MKEINNEEITTTIVILNKEYVINDVKE